MFSKVFWIDAGERAIRTAAQSFLGGFTAVVVVSTNDLVVQLAAGGLAAVVGGITSVAMSLAASKVGDTNSASVVLEVKKP